MNHNIDEDEIVAMEVPKYNQTQFNTGLAMFHMKNEQAVESALALKGTYIGERWGNQGGRGGGERSGACLNEDRHTKT